MQYLLQARMGSAADTNGKMVAQLKKRKLLTDATERAFLGMGKPEGGGKKREREWRERE